ncbi:SdpI family protein [Pseudonocardiaceae bacterium YIM PH 21723]|nr:SdpI family protein [Pseudonocardiaceae bacterium YIM PH 21723]
MLSGAAILFGMAIGYAGWRGLRRTLPRNRFFGVRTEQTLRNENAFAVANQVAGLPNLVAGVVMLLVGVLSLFVGSSSVALTVLLVGIVAAGLVAVAGGVQGAKAAALVPDEPEPARGGCAGGCCGSLCGKAEGVTA